MVAANGPLWSFSLCLDAGWTWPLTLPQGCGSRCRPASQQASVVCRLVAPPPLAEGKAFWVGQLLDVVAVLAARECWVAPTEAEAGLTEAEAWLCLARVLVLLLRVFGVMRPAESPLHLRADHHHFQPQCPPPSRQEAFLLRPGPVLTLICGPLAHETPTSPSSQHSHWEHSGPRFARSGKTLGFHVERVCLLRLRLSAIFPPISVLCVLQRVLSLVLPLPLVLWVALPWVTHYLFLSRPG